MAWEKVTYRRTALYEQVWSEPILKVVKTYGISNVGLAKICARLHVPRPGRGYWERLRRGQGVRRSPLPPLATGQSEEYVSERQSRPVLDQRERTEFEIAAAREKEEGNRVTVPEELKDPHPLVAHAEKRLRHGRANEHGIVVARKTGHLLPIQVSRANFHRGVRLLDSLVKALEARGYSLEAKAEKGAAVTVDILGESISVWVVELLNAVERKLTHAQVKDKEAARGPTSESSTTCRVAAWR